MAYVKMIEPLRKNIGEIVVIFIAVLIVYFIAIKTNTPVKSIHFIIMSTIYSTMGIFAIKVAKRSIKKHKEEKNK